MPLENEEVVEGLDLASDAIDLIERGEESRTTLIKVIQPGWGSSGYYSREVLESDGPKAWKAGTHMYFDHPTESESKERPERSVRDLAGVIVGDPFYEADGKAGPGLYARASILPQYKPLIEQLAPHIGVSIRAKGTFKSGEAEGRKGRIIEKIAEGESVDFVTKPGAGGKVLAMWESLRAQDAAAPGYTVTTTSNTSAGTTPYITISTPNIITPPAASEAAPTEPVQEATSMELKEAQERVSALEGELTEAKKVGTESLARAERAETALAILEAQKFVAGELANVSLPDACKVRIINDATKNPPLVEGKLDEAALKATVEQMAKTEAEYIESVIGSGKVTGQGSKPASEPDHTKVEESLAQHLGGFFRMSENTAKMAAKGR